MNKKSYAATLFAVSLIAAAPAWAQGSAADVTDMQALRTAVQADKKAYVAKVLELTPAEEKKFWPVYDAYQSALATANRERNLAIEGLVARDKPLSDPYAKNLMRDLLEADEAEVRARRTMQGKLMRALPPKKAARYLHLEAKVRALQAYDIAGALPLVK
jgi:Spy/CpxP family protein refolding chaperone